MNLKHFAQEYLMRIAFTGASGCGKTTLANHIVEKYALDLNPVGSRSTARALGFDSPYDVDRASRRIYDAVWRGSETTPQGRKDAAEEALAHFKPGDQTCRGLFQRRLQLDKVAWELEHESFVTDRSTVDDFVYCALHNYEAMDQEYLERARQHLQQYDLVFFTPIDMFQSTAGDAARLSNSVYHQVFEQFSEGLLITWLGDDYNEVVKEVFESDLEKRKTLIDQAVGDWKRWNQ